MKTWKLKTIEKSAKVVVEETMAAAEMETAVEVGRERLLPLLKTMSKALIRYQKWHCRKSTNPVRRRM